MPSVIIVGGTKKNHSILNRSESLRSEISESSLQSKKVSFNNDVRIRRIPTQLQTPPIVAVLDPNITGSSTNPGYFWINSNFTKSENSERKLLAEAETILQSVNEIECCTSPFPEASPKFHKKLERSKSELILTTKGVPPTSGPIRPTSSTSELRSGPIPVTEFLDFNSKYNKLSGHFRPLKIRKSPRQRIRLFRGFGGSSGGSSSSGREDNISLEEFQFNSSHSPLSSLSSSGEGQEVKMTSRYNSTGQRVSSLESKMSSTPRLENYGPQLRSTYLDASQGNTHNNNQPFSYTDGTRRTSPEGVSNGHGKPRDVIYAQVVSGERGKDGTPEKKTVHKKFSDMTTTTASSESPTDYQKHIRHFVFDKENWKGGRESSSLLSTYKGRQDSQHHYGSRNNVTTVLLNSQDDDDSLRSTTIHNNDLFIKQNIRSSSSPPRLTNRPFFYGDSRNSRFKTFDHSSSSSPHFQYSSSSREQSPSAGIPAMKLIRETKTESRKNPIIPPSTRLVNNYGNAKSHTDYAYMTEKLGYLTPSEYSIDINRAPPPPPIEKPQTVTERQSTGNFEVKQSNGWMKSSSTLPNYDGAKSKSNISTSKSITPSFSTLENNRKNIQYSEEVKKKTGIVSHQNGSSGKPPPHSTSSSGGGLISTLMRRNKGKKGVKDKKETHIVNVNGGSGGKIVTGGTKPRNKFLSLFFDKGSGGSSNNNRKNDIKSPPRGLPKSKSHVTDSEIDDAERKRDGEYHSWSSVDGSYRMTDGRDGGPKEKLTRGKSYNFGDYGNHRQMLDDRSYSTTGPRDIDTDDYRRDMAKTDQHHYKSATLGRPVMRSYVDQQSFDRTKSLDRRTLKNRNSEQSPIRRFEPPKIIVTPNSPPVVDNWEPNYPLSSNWEHESSKAKLGHRFSKSSVELDDYRRDDRRDYSPIRPKTKERLRYFGDTDGESGIGGFHSSFRNGGRSLDQGYNHHQSQNGNYHHHHSSIKNSKRETPSRKTGRHDGGLHSSDENESRLSKSSSRSVFLHAPTVAEIPPPPSMGLTRRTLSKDEISNYSGPHTQSRHLARSMSVLAPWRPRNTKDKYEVHYDRDGNKETSPMSGRPPRPPRSPIRKSMSPLTSKRNLQKSDHLRHDDRTEKDVNRSSTGGRNTGNPGALTRSRSVSTEASGWFLKRKDGSRN